MSTDLPPAASERTGPQADDPTNVRGSRIGAAVIDALLLLIPTVVIAFRFFEKREDITSCDQVEASLNACFSTNDGLYVATNGKFVALQLFSVLLGLAYYVLLQGRTGWTVGKRAVGIRVVGGAGGICGLKRAFLRYLPFLIPALIPVIGPIVAVGIFIAEFVLILAHSRRQRMGDMLAKTYVVRQSAVGQTVA